MNHSRRKAIKTGGSVLAMLFAAGILKPDTAMAQTLNDSAFSMKTLADALRAELQADGWTVTTADGQPSAQFEHTLVVTDKGYEILTL